MGVGRMLSGIEKLFRADPDSGRAKRNIRYLRISKARWHSRWMIFLEWRRILTYCVLLLLIFSSIWAFRLVRTKHLLVRIPVRILSLAVFGLASLMTLSIVSCEFSNTRSTPIYSPDHRRALRIYDYDAGATGGGTEVLLFSDYGLRSETVFDGNWKAAEPKGVHWVNDHEVEILYEPSYSPPRCMSIEYVTIRCQPASANLK